MPIVNLGLIRDERALASCFSAADLYVGPSLHETFGLACIEALACATQVVAFDCTAVPEVVRHLITDCLAKYRNIGDLTNGIRSLLDNDAERERLADRAARWWREYAVELQAQCYLEL